MAVVPRVPAPPSSVPVLDLATCTPADLDRACRTLGFLQVVGHGVPPAVADAAWEQARAFFDLPLAEKMSVALPEPGAPYGYAPVAAEALDPGASVAADLKETYVMGPPEVPGAPPADPGEAWVRSPTPFPTALPGLRPAWEAYADELGRLADRLLSLMAVALDLPADTFAPAVDRHPSALRALNYPHVAVPPAAGQLRAGAHTDYGTITVLRQDDAPGGLEVLGPDGSWIPVPSLPGAFVVNLGDLLQHWTGGRWRSTLHRVVVPHPRTAAAQDTRRQSMAFFHNANWDAVIDVLPTCRRPGVPVPPPVRAGEWLMRRYHATQPLAASSPAAPGAEPPASAGGGTAR